MRKKTSLKRHFTILKNAFDFSVAEQRGIVVLCVLLLLLIGYYFYLSTQYKENQGYLLTENPTIDSFLLLQQQYSDSMRASYQNAYTRETKGKITPFHFCPDSMKTSDWQRLGFSEKQASQITKFQSKGGKFFKKEDLKKMYCVSEETYRILEPYIQITSSEKQYERQEKNNLAEKYTTHRFELNEVDSADLLLISGIGEKTASRIISYRTRLGGFIHIDQLKDIAFIDEERFGKIEPHLFVNATNIQKINVNEATFVILVKHPYIDDYLAKSIVNQRTKSGKYTSLEDMKRKLLIPDEIYQKISPYLVAE